MISQKWVKLIRLWIKRFLKLNKRKYFKDLFEKKIKIKRKGLMKAQESYNKD